MKILGKITVKETSTSTLNVDMSLQFIFPLKPINVV